MPSARDVVPGQVFGRCTVLQVHFLPRNKWGRRRRVWWVRCACGTEWQVEPFDLLSGKILSCGCFHRDELRARNTRHGASRTLLYSIWCGLRRRCNNSNDNRYHYYGERGITVSPAWYTSFEVFRDWALTHGYEPGLSLERIDVNGDYTPENCCFIPKARQPANTRLTVWVSCWGETKNVADWSRDPRCVVGKNALWERITTGWPPEEALTKPVDLAHTRRTVRVSCWGETKTLAEWSRDPRCVVTYANLSKRLRQGWPPEAALTIAADLGNRWLHLSTPPGQR